MYNFSIFVIKFFVENLYLISLKWNEIQTWRPLLLKKRFSYTKLDLHIFYIVLFNSVLILGCQSLKRYIFRY